MSEIWDCQFHNNGFLATMDCAVSHSPVGVPEVGDIGWPISPKMWFFGDYGLRCIPFGSTFLFAPPQCMRCKFLRSVFEDVNSINIVKTIKLDVFG